MDMKLPIRRSTLLAFIGALACALLAAWQARGHIEDRVAERRAALERDYVLAGVVVPKVDLAAGRILRADDLAMREVPGGFVHANAVRPDEVARILGRVLLHPVHAGEALLSVHVARESGSGFSGRLPAGVRAVTLPVDSVSSQAGLIEPGDRVDLLVTLREAQGMVTVPLLEDVPVLATGQLTEGEAGAGKEGRYPTLTLAAAPNDAARIAHARDAGTLSVLLRARGEARTAANLLRVTGESLLGAPAARPALRRAVEIIIGGMDG